jgi:hypothetical protein
VRDNGGQRPVLDHLSAPPRLARPATHEARVRSGGIEALRRPLRPFDTSWRTDVVVDA